LRVANFLDFVEKLAGIDVFEILHLPAGLSKWFFFKPGFL